MIFATGANQQHYNTSPYVMGWLFDGSVSTEQFWWGILDKNNIHSFHLCMISRKRDEAWPVYLVWPISERFMLRWSGGKWPACCHWLNTGKVDGPVQSCLFLLSHIHVTCGLSATPCESLQWVIEVNFCSAYQSRDPDATMPFGICESWLLHDRSKYFQATIALRINTNQITYTPLKYLW